MFESSAYYNLTTPEPDTTYSIIRDLVLSPTESIRDHHLRIHAVSDSSADMSFLNNLVEKFTGNDNEERQYEQQGSYGNQQYGNQQYGNQGYGQQGPPQVPYPWVAEWDSNQDRYIFINRETGQRTHEHPQQSYGGGGGYEQRGQGGYGGGYSNEQPQQQSHAGRNAALAGVAGLAGGALLMHEGENISESISNSDLICISARKLTLPKNKIGTATKTASKTVSIVMRTASRTTTTMTKIESNPTSTTRRITLPAGLATKSKKSKTPLKTWSRNGTTAFRMSRIFRTMLQAGVVERWAMLRGLDDDVDRYDDNVDNAYDQGRDERRYDDGDGY